MARTELAKAGGGGCNDGNLSVGETLNHGMSVEFAVTSDLFTIKTARLESLDDFELARGRGVDLLVLDGPQSSRFMAGFAVSDRLIERALRLRYEVFNLELKEGLMASEHTGLDRDDFDDQMVHCVLVERQSGDVVGTYRLQAAKDGRRLYSSQEYDLLPLADLLPWSVECGRACIARDYRSPQSVLQLWSAIGSYMRLHEAHYLFGCCSLTTTDPDDGWRAMQTLRRNGWLHPELFLRAQPEYSCGDPSREFDPAIGAAIPLPKLFNAYMRLGAKVVSEPAVDREFGTVDFFVMIDRREVNLSVLANL